MSVLQINTRRALGAILFTLSNPICAELQWQLLVTSDYVIQGISQTVGDASLQGGASYSNPNGFFAGFWIAENSLYKSYRGQKGSIHEVDSNNIFFMNEQSNN